MQPMLAFDDWISVEDRPIPNDDTPIYKIICDDDGDLFDHVYQTTGRESLLEDYRKTVFWMFAPVKPTLPSGQYRKVDESNRFRKIGVYEI